MLIIIIIYFLFFYLFIYFFFAVNGIQNLLAKMTRKKSCGIFPEG